MLSLLNYQNRCVISDYTFGCLFKNVGWMYFAQLHLIISWISVYRFTNHSPDCLGINVRVCIIMLFFWSSGAGSQLLYWAACVTQFHNSVVAVLLDTLTLDSKHHNFLHL
jgi:hypothetical protein